MIKESLWIIIIVKVKNSSVWISLWNVSGEYLGQHWTCKNGTAEFLNNIRNQFMFCWASVSSSFEVKSLQSTLHHEVQTAKHKSVRHVQFQKNRRQERFEWIDCKWNHAWSLWNYEHSENDFHFASTTEINFQIDLISINPHSDATAG